MARNTEVAADLNAPPITRTLARFVATHPSRGWSDAVDHEGAPHVPQLGRLRGRRRQARGDACRAGRRADAAARAAGHRARPPRTVDMASAALVNGISSHTFDFDDTHLKTIIHPAGPVASAALALAEHLGASGRALIDALVLGIDVSCRIGNVMYPEHYDRGWHITGSTGTLGAAAACARLLALDETADHDGAGHRGVAAGGLARAVRHHDQAVPPGRRRARGAAQRAAGPDTASPRARARSRRRAASRRWSPPRTPGTRSPTSWASASRSRSTPTSRLPAAS